MKTLGRTQWIAIGALLVPFLTITGFVFANKASIADWINFLQVFVPLIVVPLLGAGAAIKIKGATDSAPDEATATAQDAPGGPQA